MNRCGDFPECKRCVMDKHTVMALGCRTDLIEKYAKQASPPRNDSKGIGEGAESRRRANG